LADDARPASDLPERPDISLPAALASIASHGHGHTGGAPPATLTPGVTPPLTPATAPKATKPEAPPLKGPLSTAIPDASKPPEGAKPQKNGGIQSGEANPPK